MQQTHPFKSTITNICMAVITCKFATSNDINRARNLLTKVDPEHPQAFVFHDFPPMEDRKREKLEEVFQRFGFDDRRRKYDA